MANTVKSARGQVVDFDLLKIKQEMAAVPKPTNVQAREDFIDQKLKRRVSRLKRDIAVVENTPTLDTDTSAT
jgi:hypothetical protein